MAHASGSAMISGSQDAGARPKSRACVDVRPHGGTSQALFLEAQHIVEASGLAPVLEDLVDSPLGRPRSLSVRGLLHAATVNGLRKNHVAHISEWARALNGYEPWQLRYLGINRWDPDQSYQRTSRLFVKIWKGLKAGSHMGAGGTGHAVTAHWVMNQLIAASLFDLSDNERSRSLAVDATPVTSWAVIHKGNSSDRASLPDPDGPIDKDGRPTRTKAGYVIVAWSKDDGYPYYVKDTDARSGHLSATNSRKAGTHTGYDLHTAVATAEITSHNGVDKARLGPEVPAIILGANLVGANTHPAEAIIPQVVEAKRGGTNTREVLMDRGYSQLNAESWALPLASAGIGAVFRPKELDSESPYQRKALPYTEYAVMIEGARYSIHLPRNLWGPLPMPPSNASEEECLAYEQAFNQRAQYRWQRLAGPDKDGFTRWQCPFCAGFLRSRALPPTMRYPRSRPLVDLPQGAKCCGGTITVSAEDMALWQRLPAGTTAWRISYGRRNLVETFNSWLKGGFVTMERKFLRIYGRNRMMLLLGFTLAGCNRAIIRSHRSKFASAPASARKSRRKRREGTWPRIDHDPAVTGPDPPTPHLPPMPTPG
jgi:hypothetical protein